MNASSFLNWIGGDWVAGAQTTTNVNPSDLTDTIGEYALADADQVESAIEAARHAQPAWAEAGLEQRHKVLNAIGEELMARSAELGRELSREEGKPLAEGVGEVYRSGQFFTYYAAEVHRQMGDTADSVRPGIEIDIRREPVGVVGVISPWNFPMATAVDTFFCLLLLIDFTCFKSPIRPPCWRQTHNLRQGDPNGTGPA